MSSPRQRQRLTVGDRVSVDGVEHVVIGVSGTRVRLADADGGVVAVSVAELLGDARFRRVEHRGGEPTQPQVGLDGLPAAALVAATWWEAHLAEVVYGVPPDAPPGTRPKPQYDAAHTSLTDREKAKAAELAVAGHRSRRAPSSTADNAGRPTAWPAWWTNGSAGAAPPPGGWTTTWSPRCAR